MKVAFATTDGSKVDEHFGRAGLFAIYNVTPEGYSLLEMRRFSEGTDREITSTRGMGRAHDERVEGKIERLSDCKIVYLTEIGGPSAARLIRHGMMPVKVKEPISIEESLLKLKETLAGTPPPWLIKAANGN